MAKNGTLQIETTLATESAGFRWILIFQSQLRPSESSQQTIVLIETPKISEFTERYLRPPKLSNLLKMIRARLELRTRIKKLTSFRASPS